MHIKITVIEEVKASQFAASSPGIPRETKENLNPQDLDLLAGASQTNADEEGKENGVPHSKPITKQAIYNDVSKYLFRRSKSKGKQLSALIEGNLTDYFTNADPELAGIFIADLKNAKTLIFDSNTAVDEYLEWCKTLKTEVNQNIQLQPEAKGTLGIIENYFEKENQQRLAVDEKEYLDNLERLSRQDEITFNSLEDIAAYLDDCTKFGVAINEKFRLKDPQMEELKKIEAQFKPAQADPEVRREVKKQRRHSM